MAHALRPRGAVAVPLVACGADNQPSHRMADESDLLDRPRPRVDDLSDQLGEPPVEQVEAIGEDADDRQGEGLGGAGVLAAEPLVGGMVQGQQGEIRRRDDAPTSCRWGRSGSDYDTPPISELAPFFSPLPSWERGGGEGVGRTRTPSSRCAEAPSPQPSPARGEGAEGSLRSVLRLRRDLMQSFFFAR